MRVIGRLLLLVVLTFGFNACFEPPHFSNVPYIDTPTVTFADNSGKVDTEGNQIADSLILKLNFKDGDGDLGLAADGADNEGIFANKYYFLHDGTPIYFVDGAIPSKLLTIPDANGHPRTDSLITYAYKRKPHNIDSLPDFVPPYECTRYDVIEPTATAPRDTLYTQLNQNTYNIFVDFYIQDPDTHQFAIFDWTTQFEYPRCNPSGFDGRFPVLSSDLSKTAPLEGSIRYGMGSFGWRVFFDNKIMKLRIYIQDRKLNRSNIIETGTFTLDQIILH